MERESGYAVPDGPLDDLLDSLERDLQRGQAGAYAALVLTRALDASNGLTTRATTLNASAPDTRIRATAERPGGVARAAMTSVNMEKT